MFKDKVIFETQNLMPPIVDFSDLRQSPAWAKYMSSLGWEVEKIDRGWACVKKLPFGLGSVIKLLRFSCPVPFKKMDFLAKKKRAWFVKLEPGARAGDFQGDFQKHGFYHSTWPLSPSKTIQLDLRKSKKGLWAGLRKETRNIVRKAEGNDILITQTEEIEQFCDLWIQNMRRKWNLLASGIEIKEMANAFGEDFYLLLAHQSADKVRPLAGVIMPVHDRVAYYFFAASTKRANRLGAPSLLVWRAILLAKKLGCQVLDFDGIYDPRYHRATKSWQGFTRFKKGFGGKEVGFTGSFIKGYGLLGKLRFLAARL